MVSSDETEINFDVSHLLIVPFAQTSSTCLHLQMCIWSLFVCSTLVYSFSLILAQSLFFSCSLICRFLTKGRLPIFIFLRRMHIFTYHIFFFTIILNWFNICMLFTLTSDLTGNLTWTSFLLVPSRIIECWGNLHPVRICDNWMNS